MKAPDPRRRIGSFYKLFIIDIRRKMRYNKIGEFWEGGDTVQIKIPDYVTSLMEILCENGEESYVVGGSLRDFMLGKVPKDYDMATSSLPSRTLSIFSDCGYRTLETGIRHGTVTVISEGKPVEITTFRVDGGYTDGRHPDSVSFTSSIEEDLARRDFTVNAMAYNDGVGLIDLFGGEEDLKQGIIRTVGEAEKRFEEDALRIMRAFRFSAALDFEIEEKTLRGAKVCRGGLKNIARERIGAEFISLICAPAPERVIGQMREYGILPFVVGDFVPLRNAEAALQKLPNAPECRLGALFYDCSENVLRQILSELKCSNKQKKGAVTVAKLAKRQILTSADAAHLKADGGEYACFALEASIALGFSPSEARNLYRGSTAPCGIAELKISGAEIAKLGVKGKEIGLTLEYLLDKTLENPLLNDREKLIELALERMAKTDKDGKNE